ncbi:DMT family transporter [Leifsonia poae]|uniref:DMT family transporter n=1 Tax=Leifsonia poae TaxID=110933 RepID=UPI001CBFCF18|nr:DMT family transporter [Leifsonia poae]
MTPSAAGAGAVLLAGVLWGTTGTAASLTPDVSPLAIGAAAMGIGGLLQALIAAPSIAAARRELRAHLLMLSAGALAVAIYPLAFYSSMRLAGVAVGTVISIASAPIASAVLELVIDRVPLSRRWIVASTLTIVGSVLLCLSRSADGAAAGGQTALGVVLGLVAGSTYALYSWCVHRLIRAGVARSAVMGSVFGLGGAALIPVLVVTGAPILASPMNMGVAAYMALIPMFGGYLLFGVGLARIRASTATTLTLVEPAIASILAVAVLNENVGPAGWSGLALVGVGLGVLSVTGRKSRKHTLASNISPTAPAQAIAAVEPSNG